MNCFPCFTSKDAEEENNNEVVVPVAQVKNATPASPPPPSPVNKAENPPVEANNDDNESKIPENGNNGAKTFTFRELAMATKNFRQEYLLGEGGFGKLYKGTLHSGEVVAVKRLDRNGTQGSKEFLVEVLMLTLLKHPNLVSLLGYCADGEQRLLVYEYLPLGSLKSYIHDLSEDKKPLDWQTRMKIASAAAQGLEYLHEKANPPVVFRDLKLSNILMDQDFNPKLSEYGLAKLAQGDSKTHISPRVMGSNGYSAPEYERLGEFTTKSDIYSFGVILLELITGRKALDTTRTDEQSLVTWAKPFFKDPKRFPEMADPLLKRQFPERNLNQAVGIAAMCLQDEPSVRPLIGDLVSLLSFLAVAPPEETSSPALSAPNPPSEVKLSDEHEHPSNHSDSSDNEDGESQYMSNSEYESGSSDVSDQDDEDNADENKVEDSQHNLHQKSKKIGKKSSSIMQKNKMGKRDSNKLSRKATRSHKIKKKEDNERTISFTSSSSGSANHRSRSRHPAVAPHASVSVTARQDSIEESQNGSSRSSLGRGKFEESFSWSIGSSSRFKSRSGSGHIDSGSSKNIELHNNSLDANIKHESSRVEYEGGNYSSSDHSDDENKH